MKPRRFFAARLSLPLVATLVALLAAPTSYAATITWDRIAGGAIDDGAGAWLGAGLWNNGAPSATWASGDDARFGNGGAGGAVTLASATTVNSLTFNSFSGTYTLGTNTSTITLNNGITMNFGAGAVTIISPITLGAAQSWTNNSTSLLTVGTGAVNNAGHLLTIGGSGNTTVSSAISGAGGLTKSGTGILTLSGANNYTGTTTVSGGILRLSAASALPGGIGVSGGTSALTIEGGVVELANGNFTRGLGSGVAQVRITGGISGFSALGAARIVNIGGASAGLTWGNPDFDPTKLVLNASTANNTLDFQNSINLGAVDRTVAVYANAATLSGALTGSGGLIKEGAGALTLSSTSNTYSGGTVINGGSLTYTNDGNLGLTGTRNITFGGTARLTGYDGSSLGQLTVGSSVVGTISGNNITFATTTGSGTLLTTAGQNKTVNIGDASTFTGNLGIAYNINSASGIGTPHLQFSKLNDAVGSSIQFYRIGGGTNSTENAQVGLTGDAGPVTFDNRQIQLLPKSGTTNPSMRDIALVNSNTNALNKWVINTNLLNSYDRDVTLYLAGGNAGDNKFAGSIGNSTNGGFALSLNKSGTGKWIVSGVNTYTGTTTISGGTLNLGVAENVNVSGPLGKQLANAAGSIVLSGGTLQYSNVNDNDYSGRFSTAASQQYRVDTNGRDVTWATPLTSSAGLLTKSGSGTLTLTGANTYSGVTTVNGGTLLLDKTVTGALAATSALTLGGGTFQVKGASSGATTQTLGALTLTARTINQIVLDPNNSGAGSTILTVGDAWTRGAGSTLLIDYSSSNTGTREVRTANATTGYALNNGIYSGILVKDSDGITGFATRAAGSNIAITRYDDTTGTTLVDNSNASGTNFTTRNSTGALSWSNGITTRSVNSLTIDTTTNGGGTINMGIGTNVLTLTSGAILFKGASDAILTGGQVGAANSEVIIHQTGAGSLTINSFISSGTGSLTKGGTGTLILGGANTYTGVTTVHAGILTLANTSALQNSLLDTNFIISGDASNGLRTTQNALILGGLSGSKNFAASGGVFTSTTGGYGSVTALTLNPLSGSATYTGVIENGATGMTLTKTGAGTQILSGANTYTGATTISAGTLSVGLTSNLGGAASNLVFDGGTLQITGTTLTNFSGIGHTVSFNSGKMVGLDINSAGNAFTADQVLNQGGGGLIKAGAGTLRLSETNTYTGDTTIGAGTLQITGSGSLGSGSYAGLIGNAGTFLYSSSTHQTLSGVIGGTGALVKDTSAASTLTLSAANTFTGTTTISAGALTLANGRALQNSALNTTGAGFVTLSGLTTPIFGGLVNTGTVRDLANVITTGYTGVTNLTLNPQSGSSSYGGVIANGAAGMSLTKTGAGTQTLSGANTYTGVTNFNAGTLTLSGAAGALTGTTGLTFNGGNLTLTNGDNDAEDDLNRIKDNAAITSNGATITYTNTTAASARIFIETIGSVDLASGQLNLVNTLDKSAGSQTLALSGLTRSGGTSAITFSNAGGLNLTNDRIRVNGVTTDTPSGQIIGPWATIGTAANAQTDYAVYDSDGTHGYIVARNIAASAQDTWLSSPTSFTLANASGSAANGKFSGTRIINALRNTTAANTAIPTNGGAASLDYFTIAGHTFADGDVVSASGTGGLVKGGDTYYVINSNVGGAGRFQLSTTSGGSAIDLTDTANGMITGGITLSTGNNLETYGILNGSSAALAIGASGTGALSTPTGGGSLFLTTGAGAIMINAPIKDNGGAVTVVRSGSAGALTLSGNNTFTGGLVVNGGPVRLFGTQSFTGGITLNGGGIGDNASNFNPLTFASSLNGNAITVNGPAYLLLEGALSSAIAINSNAVLKLGAGSSTLTVDGVVSGSGVLDVNANNYNATYSVNLTNAANTFSGDVIYSENNGNRSLNFNSIGDSGKVTFGVGASNQIFTLSSSASSSLTFNTRQFEMAATGGNEVARIGNNSTQAFTINTDLLISSTGNRTLLLQGTGTGLSTFAGKLSGGSPTSLGITKLESGTWALTNAANSYTGATTISAGTLLVSSLANGGSNSNIGASTNAASSLVLNGGTLCYTGAAVSTDRLFTLQDTGGINSSGTGALNFTNTGSMGFNGSMNAKTLTLTGTNTGDNTIAAVIGDNGGATALTKTGIGTWVVSGANTHTGATSLSGGGELALDYGANINSDNSKIAGVLALGGGTLTLKGGSHTEDVTSTALNAGGSNVRRTSGSSTLQMNAITRASGGTISFSSASIASTDTNNINSILGGWATIGNDWAINSTGAANGAITAFAGYDITQDELGYVDMNLTSSAAGNYYLEGTLNIYGALQANTIKIIDTPNGVDPSIQDELSLGENNLTITSNTTSQGGIMFAGGAENLYSITGTGRIRTSDAHRELIFAVQTGTLSVSAFVGDSGSNGGVTKFGSGSLDISSANSFNGAVYVNQGALRLSNNNAAGNVGGGILVQNGAALELTNGLVIGAELLTITGNGSGSNTGALRNIASSGSSYGGTITIGSGGARINSDALGALTLTGGVTTSLFNNVTFGGAGNTTVSTNSISGVGGLIKDGTGTTIMNVANTYFGATTINAGTLQAGAAVSGQAFGNRSAITLANVSGAKLDLNGFSQTIGLLAGGGTTGGNITLGANAILTTGGGSNSTYAGIISGTGTSGLTKTGTGILTLSGINTYTGGTTISAGSISVEKSSSLGAESSVLTIGSGALLKATDNFGTSRSTVLGGAGAGVGGTIEVVSGKELDYASGSSITGSGSLIKTGAGTLLLQGTNNFTGGLYMKAGILAANSQEALGELPTGPGYSNYGLFLSDGATFQVRANSSTNRQLNLIGDQVGVGGLAKVDITSAYTHTLNGQIKGAGKLNLVGTGTLVATAANSYTGGTLISNGVLKVGNTTLTGGSATGTGAVTVATGGTLQGSSAAGEGFITGAVTVENGGQLTATSGATLTLSGGLSLNNGSIGTFLLGSATAAPLVDITGGLFSLPGSGSSILNIVNTGSMASGTYRLFDYEGTALSDTLALALAQSYSGMFNLALDYNTLDTAIDLVVTASNRQWIKGGANTNWGTTTNWVGGVVPTGTDGLALFLNNNDQPGFGAAEAVTVDTSRTVGTITFQNTATAFTIAPLAAQTLTLDVTAGNANISVLSAPSGANHEISTPLILADNLTVDIASGTKGLEISGAISGSGKTLNKTGDGPLTLSGTVANGYSGLTTVEAGTLNLNKTAGVDAIGSGGLRIASGATVTLLASNQITNAANLNVSGTLALGGNSETITDLTGGGTVTIDSPGVLTLNNSTANSSFSGVISGTGGLAKSGTNTLLLNGANTHTGGTAINGGILQVPGDSNLGGATSNLTFNGGTFQYAGDFNSDRHVTINSGGGTFDTNNRNSTLNGVIGGSGVLTKVGAGTLTLSNVINTYSGAITISSGTLEVQGSIAASSGITNNATLIFNNSSAQSYGSIIGGTGDLTKTGAGTLTLTPFSANTYTGATNINGGTLELNGSTAASSTVSIGTAGTLTGTGTVNGNATLTGSGTINKSSGTIAGTLTVNGGNWNGAGVVTGTITSSSGTFTIGSSATLTANGDLDVIGGSIAAGNSNSKITGNVNYTSNSSSTFAGVIDGSSKTLTMDCANTTLTLSGANTYTGATTVIAGTLRFAKKVSLYNNTPASWTAANINVKAGATLALNVGGSGEFTTTDLNTLLTNISVDATSTPTSKTGLQSGAVLGFDTSNAGGSFTLANVITDPIGIYGAVVGLTKLGTGTLVLNQVNTYKGGTTVNAGTLSMGDASALGSTYGQLTVNAGTLNMAGYSLTVGNLTGTGGIISGSSGSRTLTIGDSDFGGGNYQGSIQNGTGGTTALTKTGTGTITLSGTNTYTGDTAINDGKLFINGSLANSVVTVSSGATLGGTGTLGGDTTIDIGGKLEFNLSTAFDSHDPLNIASGKDFTFSGASTLTITSTGGMAPGTYTLITGGNNITGAAPTPINMPSGYAGSVFIVNNELRLLVTLSETSPPTLASTAIVDNNYGGLIMVNTPITYTVTFSEDMDAATVSAADFGNAGTSTVIIGTVTETTPTSGVFTVPVIPTSAGTLRLEVKALANLEDVAGNALDTTSSIADDTTIAVESVFENWSGGTSSDADTNNDGVSDGLAWVLGATDPSENAIGLLPTFDNASDATYFIYTYRRSDAANTSPGTIIAVEYGSTLGTWTTAVNDNDKIIITQIGSFTGTNPGAIMQVKIKRTEAVGGKLFTRLNLTP